MVEYKITKNDDGKTIRSFINAKHPSLLKSVMDNALKRGDIKINGKRIRQNIPLDEGDILKVYISDEFLTRKLKLDVVFEDHNIMVVNKPAGISVNEDSPSLCSLAYDYMLANGEINVALNNVPHAVHRLDHYTAGLVLIAKNDMAAEVLINAMKTRKIAKYYEAVVIGRVQPESAQLFNYLSKDSKKATVTVYDEAAKDATPIVTRYQTIKADDDLSLLEIELVTGRTHQIRAHMAYIGYPVLGDDKYGFRNANKYYGVSHQALFAKKIVLNVGPKNYLSYLDGRIFEVDVPFKDTLKLSLFENGKTETPPEEGK